MADADLPRLLAVDAAQHLPAVDVTVVAALAEADAEVQLQAADAEARA